MNIDNLYKTLYPDRTLKDLQIDIIQNLINGNDVVAILATGYGKSICYQLPYLYFKKNIIVVSPLIALMEDQQMNLEKMGIPSICFNSNMTTADKEREKNIIIDCDEPKILYMTPEYLVKEEIFIKDLINENKLCLFAIDEAHCISSWGHDFRKEYQQLACLKEWSNNTIPIFACTATATPKVQKEIVTYLQLNNPKIIKSSFDRKNLYISCNRKTNNIENDISPYLYEFENDCIIIYAKTRDDTEKICEIVKSLNITCEAYHGGLSAKKRKEIHTGFVDGTYRCIVATIAFGMGIDQNVHLIIHYGLPNDMESYVQEIGRGGRDGVESKCIMFWSNKDLHICKVLLKDINNETFRKFKEKQIEIMDKWTHTNTCRKKILLKHFGEVLENPCMKCDNCYRVLEEEKKKYDHEPLYYPIFLIIKTMFVIRRGLGCTKIVDIIRGSRAKPILEFNGCETYGLGYKYNQEFLKELIRVLIFNDFLKEESLEQKFGSIIMTTEHSVNLYYEAKKYKLENEMNYIKWPKFNIPESFETVLNFLPRNNILEKKLTRQTEFHKVLDMFDLDENGNEIVNEPEFEIVNLHKNDINLTKLTIQSADIDKLIKSVKVKISKQTDTLSDTENLSTVKPKAKAKAKVAVSVKDILSNQQNNEEPIIPNAKILKKVMKISNNLIPNNISNELDI